MSKRSKHRHEDPYYSYRGLLSRWEHKCVLCGEEFDNLDSLTREHLIPKSLGGEAQDNIAPSHYNCNQLRGAMSLIDAMVAIDRHKQRLGKLFKNWCNTPVPNRRKQNKESEVA